MTWLTWRQLRTPFLIALAATAAMLAILLLTGPGEAELYTESGLARCAEGVETNVGTLTCGDLERQFLGRHPLLRAIGSLLLALPLLVGAFWGAPLVARELENGTHRLVWVQGVTRVQWLAVKLAVVGAVSVAIAAALSLVFTWWSGPADQLASRIGPGVFAQRGIVPVAYALLAFMFGVLIGAMVRRVLPAMAITVGVVVAARQALQSWLRPRLLQPLEVRYSTFTFFGGDPPGLRDAERGWVFSTRTVDAAGRTVSSGGTIRDDAAAELCGLATDNPSKEQLDACGQELGLENVVSLLPDDSFWTLQILEAAVVVTLAFAVGALCLWWTHRRLA
jgi:hypothetical protein